MGLIHNVVNLFLLTVGIALILWGEEFFRLLLSASPRRIVSKAKKLFAFLISGFVTALMGVIVFWSLGYRSESISVIIGLILFAGGGILSMLFYRYGIMTSLFLGGHAIFVVMFSPYFYFESYGEWGDILEEILDRILGYRILEFCSDRIIFYLFVIALFVIFGIYFHLKKTIRESDDEDQLQDRLRFRKTVYLCAGLAVFSYFLRLISRGYTTIFEINILNWPIIAVVFFWFIKWLADKGHKYSFIHDDKWAKFVYLIAFGLIVIPIISGLITFAVSRLLPMDIPRKRLYCDFMFYPLPAFTFRSAFSIVALSILAYGFVLKEQKIKFKEIVPVKMEVNMSYMLTGIIVGGIIGLVAGCFLGFVADFMSHGGLITDSFFMMSLTGGIIGSIVFAVMGCKVALLLQGKKVRNEE